LLIQQMVAPMAVHAMVRPALSSVPDVNLPELDEARGLRRCLPARRRRTTQQQRRRR
jgi:hypothetical protein